MSSSRMLRGELLGAWLGRLVWALTAETGKTRVSVRLRPRTGTNHLALVGKCCFSDMAVFVLLGCGTARVDVEEPPDRWDQPSDSDGLAQLAASSFPPTEALLKA
jgi:hypothetical protein